MTTSTLRLACFAAGLATMAGAERLAPHHPPTSARARRWAINFGLGVAGSWATALAVLACAALESGRPGGTGASPLAAFGAPGWLRIAVEVALLDLVTWRLHRAYHEVPLLWRLHRVHHSDVDLDVSSASRFHVGELALSALVKCAVVQALGVSVAGLVAFEVAMTAMNQLEHSNVRLPRAVESAMWAVLVPPAMHRIHHHPLPAATNSNYGTITSLWDRAFSTLRTSAPSDREFGLPDLAAADRLGFADLLRLPFRRLG